ncbi:hypothetical protein [Rhodococcus phage REQ1]|uniref:hypothetical protein n=1 Tax=Rhodococcus phage REQ1 TaxID=1109712 RepID=UPI00023EEBEE|nr:hypothetical protein RoPhREQ1_gp13 [Rhodococcus phage REQ1]AEV52009.1 hypothetical protein [Rhodococcus phage REQ1]
MADTYDQLRSDIRAEAARLSDTRRAYFYDGHDLATPNDLLRLDIRRELIVHIDLLIDKAEAAERGI